MNRTRTRFTALLGVCMLQLAVPSCMIAKRQITLERGSVYRFRTAPVDPYDAFRGRYVALGVEERSCRVAADMPLERGRKVYAALGTDTNGFARFERLSASRPEDGSDYIRTRIARLSGRTAYLELPFDRYYMNERMAPEAERVYRDRSRRAKRDAAIVVRVRKGFALIESLEIGGRPIETYLDGKQEGSRP